QTSIPAWIPLTVGWVEEKILAPLGKTPTVPIDGVRMAQQPMYYDTSKAIRELGLPQSPLSVALKDAIDWFVSSGYVNR
ncbi:MAG: dihydroflavonol 4-reductase, partial [Dolichospermum sp.]